MEPTWGQVQLDPRQWLQHSVCSGPLRSRAVLFVEGDDMKILRNLADAVGATFLRQERGLAVVPLGGFSNWHQVEPFAWLSRDLLGDAVTIFVVLDRDHREDATVNGLVATLAVVSTHVWKRKELRITCWCRRRLPALQDYLSQMRRPYSPRKHLPCESRLKPRLLRVVNATVIEKVDPGTIMKLRFQSLRHCSLTESRA